MNKKAAAITGIIVLLIVLGIIVFSFSSRKNPNSPLNYGNNPGVTPTSTYGGPNPTPNPNPNPVPVPPPTTSGPIGYIGCSNTWMTVEGYHNDGGTRFWAADQNYGGGTVDLWASNLSDSNAYWQQFDQLNAADPGAKTIWFNLCEKQDSTYTQAYNNAIIVVNEAKRRIPGATVYVSGLNTYASSDQCHITGSTGVPYTDQAAAALAQNGIALAGPLLGPLARTDTTDGCHPTPAARLSIVGHQLLTFFH